jgi:hypothetical protein
LLKRRKKAALRLKGKNAAERKLEMKNQKQSLKIQN